MTFIETAINCIFSGFCSYMGARVAKKAEKHVKTPITKIKNIIKEVFS